MPAGRQLGRFSKEALRLSPRRPYALWGPTDMLVTLESKLHRLWDPKSRQPCANRPALNCLRNLTWDPPHGSPRFVSANISPHANTRGKSDLLSWNDSLGKRPRQRARRTFGGITHSLCSKTKFPDGSRACPRRGPPTRAVQTGGGSGLGPLEQRWGWGGGAWGPPRGLLLGRLVHLS